MEGSEANERHDTVGVEWVRDTGLEPDASNTMGESTKSVTGFLRNIQCCERRAARRPISVAAMANFPRLSGNILRERRLELRRSGYPKEKRSWRPALPG